MISESAISAILDLRRQYVTPIAKNQGMELAPEPTLTTPPMVLLLGNHSSGKSSLINHLLDSNVQRTGVAPTDDGFTVLLHGDTPRTIDGDALVTNPDLPFAELAGFGSGLQQHVAGRVLTDDILRHVRLVDSPGMIDAASADAERPYDFAAVVKWFAQQADLVLLFFDPEKPGTTGETISVLNESLAGIDHKLRIVMNKMDLFDGIRDFARTYGALCWNLSRSLKTKDMPHIYTTVIPELVRENCSLPLDGFAAALLELEKYIGDLPRHRIDVVLSRVMDEARVLMLRASVTEALRKRVHNTRLTTIVSFTTIAGICAGIGWWMTQQEASLGAQIAMWASTIASLLLAFYLPGPVGRWSERRGHHRLDQFFSQIFRKRLAATDRHDDLMHDWSRARTGLIRMLKAMGLNKIKRTSRRQLKHLQRAIEHEFPEHRRQGSA